MVFSSWQFIFLFLPVSFFIYFCFNHYRLIIAGKIWLVIASLLFYSYWEIKYLPLILGSILFNFTIGSTLSRTTKIAMQISLINNHTKNIEIDRKILLAFGIIANIILLGYYKYTDFLLNNINMAFNANLSLPHIPLPLAISFFTFTQIVYLVDSYREETSKYDLLNYSLFVTFFPHLIAGPIVHHGQIMPQFFSKWTLRIRYRNILKGLFIFSIGLFKKVVIADTFSAWVTSGFDTDKPLNFFSAWATSLSYTFQLYFDFSGYCDMAIGASLLFNIWLPINFNSPYKALNIQDFWRRWHITLSNFLRDYLYIPLGGNRHGKYHTYINIFITFLLGGLWHGATWMFVIWGGIHGAALIVHRIWREIGRPLHPILSWLLTFIFVNIAWIFFRAKTMDDAWRILHGMWDLSSAFNYTVSMLPTSDLAWAGWRADTLIHFLPANFIGQIPVYLAIVASFFIISQKNSIELVKEPIGSIKLICSVIFFTVANYFMLATTSSVFLYFNF